jgi:hypothetical protein
VQPRARNLDHFFKNGKEDERNASRLGETTFREKNFLNWFELSQLLYPSRCYTSTGHPIHQLHKVLQRISHPKPK